ncbi:MAG: NAD(P)-dependent oxidoreductase [bacterium]
MSEKRIWVSGAAGFLGRHVAAAFREAGWTVSGIDVAPQDPADALAVAHWYAEGTGEAALEYLATHGLPDCIFHAAGGGTVAYSYDQPHEDFDLSVRATAQMLEFLRKNAPGATLVVPSSAAVYGTCPAEPLAEHRAPAPMSPYGRHKLMAEQLCARASETFGLRTIAIRYFSLYGAALRKQLLWDLGGKATGADGAVELYGTGEETRDLLHVEDAARLALLLVQRQDGASMVVNGGTGRALTIHRIATGLLEALGLALDVRFNGVERAGDPKHYQADVSLAESLGFCPAISFEEGIREYARWFRSIQ